MSIAKPRSLSSFFFFFCELASKKTYNICAAGKRITILASKYRKGVCVFV